MTIFWIKDINGVELCFNLAGAVTVDDFGNLIILNHEDGQTENIRRINRSHDISHLLEQERF